MMNTEAPSNGQHEPGEARDHRRGAANQDHEQDRSAQSNDKSDRPAKDKKQSLFHRPGVIIVAALLALIAIGYGAFTMFRPFTHETTDDAFVDVHIVSVAPKIAGHVATVHVNDNQSVKKGDVLVEIDPRDFQVALAQAKANLAKEKVTQVHEDHSAHGRLRN